MLWYLLAVAVPMALLAAWYYSRRYLRRRALARPFDPSWTDHLQRLPVYGKLTDNQQLELQQLITAFLYDKQFVGCEGLVVTDEMRVLIAAEACLLLLNRPNSGYQGLGWIYLYPSSFRNKQSEQDSDGVVSKPQGSLLGVSWSNGRVVLAWDSVQQGLADFTDGHNVVLHEFAHQLDQENGAADGAPLLYTRDSYRVWSQVFSDEFEQLQQQLDQGGQSLIDSYGATNPAEFFAVVTELFYERPAAMQASHSELFEALRSYYRVDPREWHHG